MLTVKDLEEFENYMRSGELETDFKDGCENDRYYLLELLEKFMDVAELADDLPLFASLKPKEEVVPVKSELAEFLEHLNPDDLTPREALEKLYELKNLSADKAA